MRFLHAVLFIIIGLGVYSTASALPTKPEKTAEDSAKPEYSLESLIKKSGLKQTEYLLEEGPISCLQGKLVFFDNKTEYTLVIGDRPLVFGLGQKSLHVRENGCEITVHTVLEDKKINFDKTDKCKHESTFISIEVKPTMKGLDYWISNSQKKNAKPEEHCILKFKDSAQSTKN